MDWGTVPRSKSDKFFVWNPIVIRFKSILSVKSQEISATTLALNLDNYTLFGQLSSAPTWHQAFPHPNVALVLEVAVAGSLRVDESRIVEGGAL